MSRPAQRLEECVRYYLAHIRREAAGRFFKWCKTWRKRAPRAVACPEKNIELLPAFFSESRPLRAKLRTTDIIERFFRSRTRRGEEL